MSLLGYLTDTARTVEDRIRRFVEEYRPEYLYVMYSGGKDSSIVLAASLKASTVPVAAIAVLVPGLTHPDNTIAILEMWRRLCPGCPVKRIVGRGRGTVKWKIARPEKHTLYIVMGFGGYGTFWDNVRMWGLPTPAERMGGGVRWCKQTHKGWVFDDLPPNGNYNGKPARILAVGVRRGESWYRAKRWPRGNPVTVYETKNIVDIAVSPIYDMSSEDVWHLARRYGIADILKPIYEKWGSMPNCVLCPLRSDRLNARAISNLPTTYLQMVMKTLQHQLNRFKPGTFARQKAEKWIQMIEDELKRRGVM